MHVGWKYSLGIAVALVLVVTAFQNCAVKFKAASNIHDESSHGPLATGRSCTFNGQEVLSQGWRMAYQNSTVPYGSACVSERRDCTDGTLSGSYLYADCQVGTAASCLFNGVTIPSGGDVDAFSTSTVPAGSMCVKEKRVCTNGSLSGSFAYRDCDVAQPLSCLFDGKTVGPGQPVTAYRNSTETSPDICVSEDRVCMNGSLSGTYTYASCNVNAPASCLFNGQTIPSGTRIVAFQEPSVTGNSFCFEEMRTCTNGSLSGSFTNSTCTHQAPGSCTYMGQTVANGRALRGYASATVPAGQICIEQNVNCVNGVPSGIIVSPTCRVLPSESMPAMQPVNVTFETIMSETPNLILSLNEQYGPHKADLNLTGVAVDYPGFKIKARVTFDSDTYRDWILQTIRYENLPSGFSNPIVAIDAYNLFSEFKSRFVNVGAGGPNRYRMTWTITGQATPQVRPIYLPRMASAPWLGNKKGKLLKIRGNETLNPSAAPFSNPGALDVAMSAMTAKLNAQSNYQVNMTHEIQEFQYIATPEQASCNLPYADELKRQLFLQNGVTIDNYRSQHDWLIYTYYPSYVAQFASQCLDVYRQGFYGGEAASPVCPMCGPGGEVVQPASKPYGPEYGIHMHELGHGMNLHDQYANDLHPCQNSDPRNIGEAQLFKIDNSCGYLSMSNFVQTMASGWLGWHDPIERSNLGWLQAGQVLTVSKTGTYDLYADNDDFTSDASKPLILQLAIKRAGKIDFVYVITFNPNIIAQYGLTVDQESKDYISNSIRLSTSHAGQRYGLAWASGGAQSFYSYFNNDPSVKYKHTIPPNVDVRINFGDTDVTLRLVEKTGQHARVSVTYNKPLL